MKKRMMSMMLTALMTTLMVGCGQAVAPAEQDLSMQSKVETPKDVAADGNAADDAKAEDADKAADTEEPANTDEVTLEDIIELTGATINLPYGAEKPVCSILDDGLCEIKYTKWHGSAELTLRVKNSDAFIDISDYEREWDQVDEDTKVCGSYEACNSYVIFTEDRTDADVIRWYDADNKVMYSLLTETEIIDGYDAYAAAELIMGVGEDYEALPSNGIEERAGKKEFDSYDEMIGLLEAGEGYALVKVKGYEGDVLIIAEDLEDSKNGKQTYSSVYAYTLKADGYVTWDSGLYCCDEYPMALDDEGVIHICSDDLAEEFYYVENATDDMALASMNYISVWEYNGETTVNGYYRDLTNATLYHGDKVEYSIDDIGVLDELRAKYDESEAIVFTAAE